MIGISKRATYGGENSWSLGGEEAEKVGGFLLKPRTVKY
jgi:hypothetical protein